jgi:hypothetical protein
MTPRIIGFSGRKYNGKDTAAKQLINDGYTPMSFAEPIKDVAKMLFGFSENQVNGTQKEELDVRWNTTPRAALQFIGTEVFREQIQKLLPEIGADFWVKSLENRIPSNTNVVITDVRFPNEVAMIHRLGGKVIRVRRALAENPDTHISEQHIDLLDADYDIDNNGTVEELHRTVKNIERSLEYCL